MIDATGVGLLAGWAVDRVVGDPRRWHPVAGFGRLAGALESRIYADSTTRGAVFHAVLVGPTCVIAILLDRLTGRSGLRRSLVVAAATATVLGGRTLEREAMAISRQLSAGDLAAARVQIRSLVGRDPDQLDANALARGCVESVAENGSDAVVAPLFYGALAGLPGLLGYRAINTLDAMVGYRSSRYGRFGKVSARVDDVANYLPARLTALVTALVSPLRSGRSPGRVLAIVRRDAGKHPSPNAGPVEAAFAAALGRALGGVNTYEGATEDRGILGDGPTIGPADIPAAVGLSRLVSVGSLLACLGLRYLVRRAGGRLLR